MGMVTQIELVDLETGMRLPKSLFAFVASKKEGFND